MKNRICSHPFRPSPLWIKRSSLLRILVGLGVITIAGCLNSATDPAPDEESSVPTNMTVGLSADNALDSDYVSIPHGGQVHKSCVHQLADQDVVDELGAIHSADGSVHPAVSPCAFPMRRVHSSGAAAGGPNPTDNGWTEDAGWTSSVAMRQFGTSFHVPAAPSLYTGQTIFLFPGMEDLSSNPSIIQAVLQYGPSAAGGGASWAIAGWFGGGAWGGNYFHTALRGVSTGEVIRGGIYQTTNCHPAGCEWDVAVNDSNNANYMITGGIVGFAWQWVIAGAIEVYNIDDCRKYPATYDNFYDFFLQDGNFNSPTPQWQADINVSTCGERVVTGTSLVELHY